LHGTIQSIGSDIASTLGGQYDAGAYGGQGGQGGYNVQGNANHRFGSFASPKNTNDVKWHIDGCAYMWAVSMALEGAKESIWILDCKIANKGNESSLTSTRVAIARVVSSKTPRQK